MKRVEVNLRDSKSGEWAIESFTVKEKELSQIMSIMKTGRGVPAGNYKRLMRNGVVVMSNTPYEIRDARWFVNRASGKVLINGLGMGVVVNMLLEKDNIEHITIIEKSADVIKLTSPAYKDNKRVTIIHADCFDYKPPKGEKYNAVWHDIWDYITTDNLDEMKKLHRKYGRKTEYQESWCRDECKRMIY